MVGAGGIGCELLKNIVLAGFRDIHVVSAALAPLLNFSPVSILSNSMHYCSDLIV